MLLLLLPACIVFVFQEEEFNSLTHWMAWQQRKTYVNRLFAPSISSQVPKRIIVWYVYGRSQTYSLRIAAICQTIHSIYVSTLHTERSFYCYMLAASRREGLMWMPLSCTQKISLFKWADDGENRKVAITAYPFQLCMLQFNMMMMTAANQRSQSCAQYLFLFPSNPNIISLLLPAHKW